MRWEPPDGWLVELTAWAIVAVLTAFCVAVVWNTWEFL